MNISKLKIRIDIILFTLTRTVINTSYRMVYPFLPVFARGLGVEPAKLALSFSVRSFLGIFGPFLATVSDTHDRKTGILLGIGLFTAGSGVVGIWPSFWGFILGTSLVLLGNGVFIPAISAYLGDRIAYEKRGRVLAITELSWALAFIGGILVQALIEPVFLDHSLYCFYSGWRLVFSLIYALLSPAEKTRR